MQIILQGTVTKIATEKLYEKVDVQVSTQRLSGKIDVIRVLFSEMPDVEVGDYIEIAGYIKFLPEHKSLCIKAQNYTKLDELPTQQKNIILGEAKLAKTLNITRQNERQVGHLHLVDKWENEINCSVWGDNIALSTTFEIGDTIDIVGRLHSHTETSLGKERYVTEISVLKLRTISEDTFTVVTVNLDDLNQAKEFVRVANSVTCNILLISDIYRVDGKSILGVFSLDLSKDIHCKITGEQSEINKFLSQISNVRKE